jgi:hypothetical protein
LWVGWEVARRNVYCEARPALAARCAARQLTRAAPQEVRWDQAIRQPANTVSNLPFALTGAHMLALGMADARAWWRSNARMTSTLVHSELQRYPLFSLANGAAQLWVAAGSLLFHASYTRAGQRADMGAVYTVLLCPLAYLAQRLGLLGPGDAHVPFAAALLAAGAWFTHNKWRLKSMRVVPAFIMLLVLLKALWLIAGSGEREANLRRWLWGPQRRDRPAGLAWPLLSAALFCIVLAFGACPLQLYCWNMHLLHEKLRRLHRAGYDAHWLRPARSVPVACRLALRCGRVPVAVVCVSALRAAAQLGRDARRRACSTAGHVNVHRNSNAALPCGPVVGWLGSGRVELEGRRCPRLQSSPLLPVSASRAVWNTAVGCARPFRRSAAAA